MERAWPRAPGVGGMPHACRRRARQTCAPARPSVREAGMSEQRAARHCRVDPRRHLRGRRALVQLGVRPGAHRRRHHGHRRGHLRVAGRRPSRRRSSSSRAPRDRAVGVRDRAPLAGDVPQRVRARRADPQQRDRRDRDGVLGHRRQGARPAGLRAARRPGARAPAGLRQCLVRRRRRRRRDRAAAAEVRRQGLSRPQVRPVRERRPRPRLRR